MTPQKFFNKYVGVDYHYADDNVDNDVFILAPVNGTCVPGSEYPYKPIGEDCVFYNNEKCSIHDVKPHECASYLHGDSHQESMELKLKIVTAWNTDENQQRIKDLLGRDPKTSFPSSFFEAFELF